MTDPDLDPLGLLNNEESEDADAGTAAGVHQLSEEEEGGDDQLPPPAATVNTPPTQTRPKEPVNAVRPPPRTLSNFIPAEADEPATVNYKKITSCKLQKRTPAAIGGTGACLGSISEIGSFYNPGDNRVTRSCYREDAATLSVTSMSVNPSTWECISCPRKHFILSKSNQSGSGGGGGGDAKRTVIVLCDQNFPGLLPTVTGNCIVIIRLAHGLLDELGDLLCGLIPKHLTLPSGTVILMGSLSHLSLGLAAYATGSVKAVRRFAGLFRDRITTVPFIPPPMGGCFEPQLVRSILDGCNWLQSVSGYNLKKSMSVLSDLVMQDGGPFAIHFDLYIQHLPN